MSLPSSSIKVYTSNCSHVQGRVCVSCDLVYIYCINTVDSRDVLSSVL